VITKSRRLSEFLGLLSFGLALMLLTSLATYDPADPAVFFKAGHGGPARNFIGPLGSFLAELLIPQLFGLAALMLPLVLALVGWKLFWCRPLEAAYTKATGVTLLLLSLTALLALSVGAVAVDKEPVRAGGAVGELLAARLVAGVNRPGAYILLATLLFVSIILATQFSFAAFLSAIGKYLSARLRVVTTAWARFRETRRKEKMRQEVIRKHAQRDAGEGEPMLHGSGRKKGRGAASEDEGEEPPSEDVRWELGEDEEDAEAPAQQPRAADARVPALRGRALQKPLPFTDEGTASGSHEEEAPPRARGKRRADPSEKRAAGPRGSFPLPSTSILDAPVPQLAMDRARLFEKARTLQQKSEEFGVLGSVVEIHPGPVVTTYEFKPDAGIKYSKVVGLADDLALGLEAESIRIDRMSGRGTVAIEIPNEVRETISLREIVESDAFRRATSRLSLALGKTVSGETYVTDLTGMPHLLVAGATGQGKSVGLNCMISSLLLKATPDEVRLILIDPKRLELGVYEDIPHLLTPVVTEPKMAANVLKWAVGEMERRIRMLAGEGVRNIEQFNNIVRGELTQPPEGEEAPKPLHYIVIIIDELADLMMVSSHDVEESICRLAQMARAVGIHLILATQRPSVDVLTGLIKANFPSRISFKVSARVDSRTILDSIGAEHLLGKGDMLFVPPGSARLTRVHGAYVSEQEIARLVSYLKKAARPVYDESVGKPERATAAEEVEEKDELFDEAVRFVVQSGQASTSMLQRRFRIGFSRAGRLVDLMEREGIVGPADGSKAREILVARGDYEAVAEWQR
jgi:S-DNA-T family DNA segregation ATPase FtsK/SpoIIIE